MTAIDRGFILFFRLAMAWIFLYPASQEMLDVGLMIVVVILVLVWGNLHDRKRAAERRRVQQQEEERRRRLRERD